MANKLNEVQHYLTFYLDQKPYAISVVNIMEVQESAYITRVPRMSPHIKGVLNLRGSIVPVMDLRLLLDMEVDVEQGHNIVILELNFIDDRILVGALVDSVDEVIEISRDDIIPAPKVSNTVDGRFIHGMVEKGDDIIIVLDIERVIAVENDEDFMVFEQSAYSEEYDEDDDNDNDDKDESVYSVKPLDSINRDIKKASVTADKLDQLIQEAEAKQNDEPVVQPAQIDEVPVVKSKKKAAKKRKTPAKKDDSQKGFDAGIPDEDKIDDLD